MREGIVIAVIKLIKRHYNDYENIHISPNFIAEFCYNRNISVRSEEIVEINNRL